jgi:hypothetical protein
MCWLALRRAWDEVVQDLRAGPETEGGILLYVHGYNNAFEDAALRAEQVADHAGFLGRAMVFSWPSAGSLLFRWTGFFQWARTPARHAGGQRFESSIAQCIATKQLTS